MSPLGSVGLKRSRQRLNISRHNALQFGLPALNRRSVGTISVCTNKDSTSFSVVQPELGLFHYDLSTR